MDSVARRNIFNWDDLQVFHAVAACGSMSGAAAALGCQQSTVSKRIRQLEARLDARLIERRVDGVTLTAEGEAALHYAETMQRSASRLETEVEGMNSQLAGAVTLSTPDGIGAYWLTRHIPKFQQAYPDIFLNLVNEDTQSSMNAALLVSFKAEHSAEVESRRLMSVHYMPMASIDYVATYGAPESVYDVLTRRFAKLEQYNPAAHPWNAEAKKVNELVRYSLSTNVSAILLETVLNGGGIAMLPTYIAAQHPDRLVVLDYDFQFHAPVWLRNAPSNLEIARIRVAADWLLDVCSPKAHPWFREEFVHPAEFCDVEVLRARA